jgi:hypothetical protein
MSSRLVCVDPLTLVLAVTGQGVNNAVDYLRPFSCRTSDSSREPFSMVKMRLLSGTVVRSQPASVVLPELVAPATQVETP